MPLSTTFERSCEHWSAERSEEMQDFYALAWVDYQHLAQARDWVAWFSALQQEAGERPLELLDVACGSGKFPAALRRDTSLMRTSKVDAIRYSLLDPSPFSIAQARVQLAPPFHLADEFVTTLQGLEAVAGRFDVVWATHALYAIPPDELKQALQRLLEVTRGVGFIAHSNAAGHYIRCYEHYLQALRPGEDLAPYTTAEQIVATLEDLGVSCSCEDLTYSNGTDQTGLAEGYLQRCVFDGEITLAQMLASEPLGDYLRSCREAGRWCFPQSVKMISFDLRGHPA
ncbi:MAG: class I SAM-dependent methyltransferase [Pseudomonadota bacterium]